MALTDAEVAEKVRKRLGLPIAQRPNIILFVTPARVAVARSVAAVKDESRKSFQKVFGSLALTAQSTDLSTSVNLDPKTLEPMIVTYPFPAVRVAASNAWYRADYQLMQLGKFQNDQIFYALEGNIVHFRNKTTVTGAASITAQYVPLIANWPQGRYEIDLIEMVSSLFAAGVR